MSTVARLRRIPLALVCAGGVLLGTTAVAAAASPTPPLTAFVIKAATQMEPITNPQVITDTGTAKGKPIGSGDITLTYTLRPKASMATVTFTISNENGTLTGKATTRYTTARIFLVFTGFAEVTGGTGRYAGMVGKPLQFNALHNVPKQTEVVSIVGAVKRM